MTPHILIKVNFMPHGFAGYAYGPFVLINRELFTPALLAHELTHVRQWYRTLGTHGIWYKLSRSYRLRSEVEAYREQLKEGERPIREMGGIVKWSAARVECARLLATRYNLGITVEQALELLA